MNSELLKYTVIIIFYAVLFLFTYDSTFEGLILMLYLATNTIVGSKIILDTMQEQEAKSININELNNYVFQFLLSSHTLVLLTLLLFYFLGMMLYKGGYMDYIVLTSVAWVSMMLLSTLFNGNKIPYYGLYGVGILGIVASNIMMLISFSRIKMESMTGEIPLSKTNRKRLEYYKTLMIFAIFLIGFSFYLFVVNDSNLSNKSNLFMLMVVLLYMSAYAMIYYAYILLNLTSEKMITDDGKNIK